MSRTAKQNAAARRAAYPFGEPVAHPDGGPAALVELSHTPAEQRLYAVMLRAAEARGSRVCALSVRELMIASGLQGYSAVRRARAGLVRKLSVDCHDVIDGAAQTRQSHCVVYAPREVIARRRAAGLEVANREESLGVAVGPTRLATLGRLLERRNLSRRECQVALYCVEGDSNSEIGERLGISEETVKFHLRNVFAKTGVTRRAELISCLLAEA